MVRHVFLPRSVPCDCSTGTESCCLAFSPSPRQLGVAKESPSAQGPSSPACVGDDSGLKLPPGFLRDGLRRWRWPRTPHGGRTERSALREHLVRRVLRKKTRRRREGSWSPSRTRRVRGKAGVIERFGETLKSGGAGGTGIGLYKGSLYAEINDRIVRYKLPVGRDRAAWNLPKTIVSGLPLTGDHPMHPFVIDADGSMYVDVASASNACQAEESHSQIPRGGALHGARDPGVASGAMTRTRRTRPSHQRHGTRRESATQGPSPSVSAGRVVRDSTRTRSAAFELARSLPAGRGKRPFRPRRFSF